MTEPVSTTPFLFLRTSVEPVHLWKSPQNLWQAMVEYVTIANQHPLTEEKVFGTGARMTVNKTRALSVKGFCIFINCTEYSFNKWSTDEAFEPIINQIKSMIYTQKFEAAAADLLNTTIIKSDLGLSDKKEFSGPAGAPIRINDGMSAKEASDAYALTLSGAVAG